LSRPIKSPSAEAPDWFTFDPFELTCVFRVNLSVNNDPPASPATKLQISEAYFVIMSTDSVLFVTLQLATFGSKQKLYFSVWKINTQIRSVDRGWCMAAPVRIERIANEETAITADTARGLARRSARRPSFG
jgi:hypothetical protein